MFGLIGLAEAFELVSGFLSSYWFRPLSLIGALMAFLVSRNLGSSCLALAAIYWCVGG